MTTTFKDFLDNQFEVRGGLSEIVEKHSPGTLRRLGGNLLHRGVSSNMGKFQGMWSAVDVPTEVFIKSVRKDRKPRNTNTELSRRIDNWFRRKFDWAPRAEGVFVFGEEGRFSTSAYGVNQCVVFPVGKFSYVWSPKVDDLYTEIPSKIFNDVSGRWGPAATYDNDRFSQEKFDEYMESLGYTNNKIEKGAKMGAEIMIDCDEILLIKYNTSDHLDKIRTELLGKS